jgi:hypothetical protein
LAVATNQPTLAPHVRSTQSNNGVSFLSLLRAQVSETAIKSGFRSCRKDVEAEQQAQATKNADGLNAVMQMLMTLQ